ncbi:hypothetical protein EYF80_036155 [Liparis tanakae]|uniref:Uncharacterized protein n=1 Tax=Liparis tanakae TaxID=230148 RepID=A0A4Z2GJG3_9TELE|nr:hypothetical protein EYF80_036155 [Liparis tanakae]
MRKCRFCTAGSSGSAVSFGCRRLFTPPPLHPPTPLPESSILCLAAVVSQPPQLCRATLIE